MKRLSIYLLGVVIVLVFAFFGLRLMLLGRLTMPTTAEFVALARQQQPLAQAIADYRADHGVLPRSLGELEPEYASKATRDPRVSFDGEVLHIRADAPHTGVYYRFSKGNEGWFVGGDFGNGPLPLPKISSTRPARSSDETDAKRLQEYDRRIQADVKNEGDLWRSHKDKIIFLVSRNRTVDAIDACRAAIKQLPDWWRPRMSLLYLLPKDAQANEEIAFQRWVDENPTFVHHWLMSKYLRDQARDVDAIAALERAAQASLADQDADAAWVPEAYAFDAAAFAAMHGKPKLVLAITDVWERPRGSYTYHDDNLHAFRAAAYLELGDFDRANANLARVLAASKDHAIWARNLDHLAAAVQSKDQAFIYDANWDAGEWVLFDLEK